MRPMFGMPEARRITHPTPFPTQEDKDEIIRQLRASLEDLTAKNRARVAKHRKKNREQTKA